MADKAPTPDTSKSADDKPVVQPRATRSESKPDQGELTKKAEDEGTIDAQGTNIAEGVQAANTVPAATAGDVVPFLPGTNPAAVNLDMDNQVKVTEAYLGGDAAREQQHPRPPAYGSPGYETWMFENRKDAVAQRKASDKE